MAARAGQPMWGPLTTSRYLGLAGSAALATGAYYIGARPGQANADATAVASQAAAVLACLAGLIVLTVAWWRAGAITARPGAAQMSGRWVLVTAALWALPLLAAPPLASRDVYAYACQGATLRAGLDPHLSGAAALPCPWLDSVPPIWREAPSPYGPLFGLLGAAIAAGAANDLSLAVAGFRILSLAGVALAVWGGRALADACRVDRARAGWLGLASPLVAVHAISGAHNDALMAGLVVAALALAASAWPRLPAPAVTAGVLLGLAVGVKVTALVALPFLIALLARADAGWRTLLRAGTVTTAAASATYAVLAIGTGLGLGFRHGLASTAELVAWTSVPTAVGLSGSYLARAAGLDAGAGTIIAVARIAGAAGAAAIVAALWWRAWREGTVRAAVLGAAAGFAAAAWFGPVSFPWYALTPLALFAVAITQERVRAWWGVVAATLSFLVLPNGVGLAARTKPVGAVVVTAAVVAALARWRAAPKTATATGLSTPGRSRRRDPPPVH